MFEGARGNGVPGPIPGGYYNITSPAKNQAENDSPHVG